MVHRRSSGPVAQVLIRVFLHFPTTTMKFIRNRLFLGTLGFLILILSGCGRSTEEPPEMSAKQLADHLNSTFAKSSSKAKAAEAGLASALQNGQLPMAFAEARTLAANPDLTPEERAAAAQAIVATVKELRRAADSGDKEAAEVVRAYTSSR